MASYEVNSTYSIVGSHDEVPGGGPGYRTQPPGGTSFTDSLASLANRPPTSFTDQVNDGQEEEPEDVLPDQYISWLWNEEVRNYEP